MPNLFTLNPFFVLLKNEMLCISLRLELSSAINYWHRIKSLIFQYLNVTERFKVPILSTLVNRGLCFPSKQSFLKLSMIRIFSAFRQGPRTFSQAYDIQNDLSKGKEMLSYSIYDTKIVNILLGVQNSQGGMHHRLSFSLKHLLLSIVIRFELKREIKFLFKTQFLTIIWLPLSCYVQPTNISKYCKNMFFNILHFLMKIIFFGGNQ